MSFKSEYDEIMDRITVTEEMRTRILQNISHSSPDKAPVRRILPFRTLRNITAAAAAVVIVAAGSLVMYQRQFAPTHKEEVEDVDLVLGPVGFEELESAETLSEALGFEVEELTELPFTVDEISYTAVDNELAEIYYSGTDQSLTYRKSAGSEDNSGDYTEYREVYDLQLGTEKKLNVTLKGEDGAYELALWQDGDFSCSLGASAGMPEETWRELLEQLIR